MSTEPLIETLREIVRMSVDRFAEIVTEEVGKLSDRNGVVVIKDLEQTLIAARKRWRDEMTA